MKKFGLYKQLTWLYFVVLLITSALFAITIFIALTSTYEKLYYSRLYDYTEGTRLIWEDSSSDNEFLQQERFFVILIDQYGYRLSSNTNVDIAKEVIEFASKNLEKDIYSGGLNLRQKKYMFVTTFSSSEDRQIIVFGSTSFIDSLREQAGLSIFFFFLIVLGLGCLFISSWAEKIVYRINNIIKHVAGMPDHNYSKTYTDSGNDEISELTLNIENMREKIEQNEKTKQEILQNVSHDLKTPLAVIKSYAEAIRDGVETLSATEVIIQQSNYLQSKVNKLLQLNRLEYLEQDRDFEEINMKDIVSNICNSYRFLTDVEFIIKMDNVKFNGYYENMYTVCENIIDNASRYAKSKVIISSKGQSITFYNDGAHIEDHFLKDGFTPYEKGSSGQFGLGMSIVSKTLVFFGLLLETKNEEVGVSFTIKKNRERKI